MTQKSIVIKQNRVSIDEVAGMVKRGFDEAGNNLASAVNSLEIRIDGVESNLGKRIDDVGKRIDGVEKRMDGLDVKMDGVQKNLTFLQKRFNSFEVTVENRFDIVEEKMQLGFNRLSKLITSDKR